MSPLVCYDGVVPNRQQATSWPNVIAIWPFQPTMNYNIETSTKRPSLCKRHFETHLSKDKCRMFIKISSHTACASLHWNYSIFIWERILTEHKHTSQSSSECPTIPFLSPTSGATVKISYHGWLIVISIPGVFRDFDGCRRFWIMPNEERIHIHIHLSLPRWSYLREQRYICIFNNFAALAVRWHR